MDTPGSENAMTEIALALAMGFFSLMVLTLISFGTPDGSPARTDAVTLAASSDRAATGAAEIQADDLLVVLHQGRFLDADAQPLRPEAIAGHPGRVTLAVRPDAALADVIDARTRIDHADLIVTQLDAAWLAALDAAAKP
jgi:hypothetical protein